MRPRRPILVMAMAILAFPAAAQDGPKGIAFVEAPEQLQTTATPYDPAISGELIRPISSFSMPL